MRLLRCALAVCAILFLSLFVGISKCAEIAKANNDVITSEEFIQDYRVAATAGQGPDTTADGKREFLDRIISKHLLSQYFHSRGWDTLSTFDSLLAEYEKGQYLQALYYEKVPESRVPGSIEVTKLMDLSRIYVDSLQKAYNLVLDDKAIVFMGDRSVVRRMEPGSKSVQPTVKWTELFTDDEKKMPVATMVGGPLTIGEFVEAVEKMPPFARPTGGNTDQIALTVEHFGREKIFEREFDKLGLRDQPFFRERMKKKQDEAILTLLFSGMQDTSTVTEEEVKEYYDSHRDYFMTVPTISLAVMTFTSEDIARQAAKKLEAGSDFESVAVDFSIYSSSQAGFDTTGYIDKSKSAALFDALWEKEIGATAGPILDNQDWKVAKLLGRRDPRLLDLKEATPMIIDRLAFLKADAAFAALLEDLRSTARIEIDDKALEAIELPKVG